MAGHFHEKFTAIFAIFSTFIFVIAKSQTQFLPTPVVSTNGAIAFADSSQAANTGGSAIGTSAVQSISSTPLSESAVTDSQCTVTATFPDPTTSLFAHSITQALKTSNVFKNFANFELIQPYQLFYQVGHGILVRDGILDDSLAELVGESGTDAGLVSSFAWFNAMGYMMAKFFSNNGLLTSDKALTYPHQILRFAEEYANIHGLHDTKSLIDNIANGFYDFLNSLGLINSSNLTQLFNLFAEEIVATSHGAES